ncbi:unnamed protein product [Parascedosporium putredinis]|uniref:Replication protein A subunit n=1 Tax=Parascedosporium putredinis TaxID=1442378 RepID=A0A9P1H393_9PEZI|nr:unnamed protein product [Parascedosporium putredinis]CAI7995595.1 unnamed protein product [Parascedosporium putredinis]
MDPSSALSRGWLQATFFGEEAATEKFPSPVVQILVVKSIPTEGGVDRHRLVLSDGDLFCQAMVATQSHYLIADQQLEPLKIVRIKQYQKNVIKQKRIMVILDLELPSVGQEDQIQPIAGASFYGNKTEEKKPPRPSDKPNLNIYPIEALSPFSSKWTIRARVSAKSDIRTWHRNNTDGKLFSVNLLDETSEIKATGFNEQVDEFYNLLQPGQVYYISTPCRVQFAKKQFTNLPNDYELTFERGTIIEKADDQSSVPQLRFAFCNLADLEKVEKDTTVDVIGVLTKVHDVASLVSKTTNKPYDKRDLTLADDSGFDTRLTIWGKQATSFDVKPESVIAFKGVKVSDFNGRSLSLLNSGTMSVDPDIPDAHRLKGWYDSQGRTQAFSNHSNLGGMGKATGRKDDTKLISQVKDENLGMGDEPSYFSLKATVVFIRQKSFCYPACSNTAATPPCNKKVEKISDDAWRCEKCSMNFPKPSYRFILGINVADHTGQTWLSCFDDVGRLITGTTADQIMEVMEDGGEAAAAHIFEESNCRTYNFRCRARKEIFQETETVRYQVLSATPVDFKAEGNKLAELIKQYSIN